MSQIVRVRTLYDNGTCLVEMPSQAVESCSGNCASCGACGSKGPVQMTAWNTAKANPGDLVELEPANNRIQKQTVLVYTLPPACMIACAAVPVGPALKALLAFGGLIGGLLITMAIINRNNGGQKQLADYEITRIVE